MWEKERKYMQKKYWFASDSESATTKASEVSIEVPIKPVNPTTNESKDSASEPNVSEDLLLRQQKCTAVASGAPNSSGSSQANPKSPVEGSSKNTQVITSTCTVAANTSTTSSFHPKLKKAWLQRHSDEDKTGVGSNANNANTSAANVVSSNAGPTSATKSGAENTDSSVDTTKDVKKGQNKCYAN